MFQVSISLFWGVFGCVLGSFGVLRLSWSRPCCPGFSQVPGDVRPADLHAGARDPGPVRAVQHPRQRPERRARGGHEHTHYLSCFFIRNTCELPHRG